MIATEPRDIRPADHVRLLSLNDAHVTELSAMTLADLDRAVATAFYARCFDDGAGFLLAYDEGARLLSPNFHWFKARYDRFVYIDRLAIAGSARGKGLAQALYGDLERTARAARHVRLACEVNLDPPNPGSLALHTRLGFRAVGEARIPSGKTVAYLIKELAS